MPVGVPVDVAVGTPVPVGAVVGDALGVGEGCCVTGVTGVLVAMGVPVCAAGVLVAEGVLVSIPIEVGEGRGVDSACGSPRANPSCPIPLSSA